MTAAATKTKAASPKIVTLDAKANKTSTSAAVSLPSPHIDHSAVFENEMQNRLHQFNSGIIALQSEVEGQETAHQKAIAELTKKHDEAKADLVRRIANLERGKLAVSAALDSLGSDPQSQAA